MLRWQRRRRHCLRESNWAFQDGTCPHIRQTGSHSLGPHRCSSPKAHGASSLPASYLSSSHFCSGCTLLGLTTSLLPAFCSLQQSLTTRASFPTTTAHPASSSVQGHCLNLVNQINFSISLPFESGLNSTWALIAWHYPPLSLSL